MLNEVVHPSIESGRGQVQALVNALVDGSSTVSLDFGRLLLQKYGQHTRQAFSEQDGLSDYELLLEITRWLLENDLEDTLIQFQRKGITKKESAQLCSFFWGALVVHVELFLRMPPVTGRPIITEKKGWLVVALDGHPQYKFQEPLSAARIKSLFSTLGQDLLYPYLETYPLNKKILAIIQSSKLWQDPLLRWIDQKSLRSLERARQALFRRLWEAQTSQAVGSSDFRLKTPAYETIHQALSQTHQTEELLPPVQASFGESIGALYGYARQLAETLFASEDLPFVVPDLRAEDEHGNPVPADLNDLCTIQGLCLLAGLPGGGKTTVQNWVARKRLTENLGFDVFLDLKRFARSNLPSPYEYAADMLVREFGVQANFRDLRLSLIDLDRRGLLYWHVENWDRVAEDERKHCLTRLVDLSTALLSTCDPQEILGLARERGLAPPKQVFHLLPWDDRRESLFIEQYCDLRPSTNLTRIRSLTNQLPGMASLPGGIRYLCECKLLSLVDILIGFLSTMQTKMGNSPVTVSISRSQHTYSVDWGNPFVNQAYEIVSAVLRRGPIKEFDIVRLERMDPVTLGAQLLIRAESLTERIKWADEYFKAGLRGGLLYRASSLSYAFVVPEIAHLMASVAVCTTDSADILLKSARESFVPASQDIPTQILRSFIEWYSR